MDLKDFVFIQEDLLGKEAFETFSKISKEILDYQEAGVIKDGKNVVDKKIRQVKQRFLTNTNDEKSFTKVFWYKFLSFKFLQALDKMYKSQGARETPFHTDLTLSLLKYEVGAFYDAHSDYHFTIPRRMSFIYGLNDDYEGGELIFHFPGTDNGKIRTKSNALIIFPSNHLFVHSVSKVTKGVRNVVVGWMP